MSVGLVALIACTALKPDDVLPARHGAGGTAGARDEPPGGAGSETTGGANAGHSPGGNAGEAGASGHGGRWSDGGAAGQGGAPGESSDELDCDLTLAPTQGKTFYACDCLEGSHPACVPGDDENDGSDPSHPVRSFGRANGLFRSLLAGETLALCRGGAFERSDAALPWNNAECQVDQPCTVRDYAAPWGDGQQAQPTLRSTGDAAPLHFQSAGAPELQDGYRFINLSLRGDGHGNGVYIEGEVSDALFCGLGLDHFANGARVVDATVPAAHIRFHRARFTRNVEAGFVGGCAGCVVEHSYFENSGVRLEGAQQHVRISHNEFRDWSQPGTLCSSSAVELYGDIADLEIDANLMVGPAGPAYTCAGISSYGSNHSHLVVSRNTVRDVNGWGIRLSDCADCRVENNLIHRSDQEAALAMTGIELVGESSRTTIRNNTIIVQNSAANMRGIALGSGTDFTIVNNLIVNSGANTGWQCFYAADGSSASYWDHNWCWVPSATAWKWSGDETLDEWRARGFDLSSASSNPQLDTSALPARLSPVVDGANSAYAPESDLLGNPRGDQPDVGAFELQ